LGARHDRGALGPNAIDLAAELAAVRDTLVSCAPGDRVVWVPVTTNGRLGAVRSSPTGAARRWLVRCEGMAPERAGRDLPVLVHHGGGHEARSRMTMDEDDATVMAMAFEIPTTWVR